jgi:hypothetical protein
VAHTAARQLQGRPLADLGRRPALRLRVLATRGHLDGQLAAGADPDGTETLKLRAAQLLRPRYRRRLATAVEHLVDELEVHRGHRLSSAVPFLRDQVAEARSTLVSLASVLRASERVHPRGVAMVWRLLSDPASPLYLRTAPGGLERHAQVALDCLVGQPWVSSPGTPLIRGGGNGDR